MNYPSSQKILDAVHKATSIVINIHHHPDYDSVSSALSLSYVLGKMGKKNRVIGCQKLNSHFYFLDGARGIEFADFTNFDFSPFDLFIIPDTGSYDRVTGSRNIPLPKGLEYAVIDHHKTNDFNLALKIMDVSAASTTEVLYGIYKDWGIEMDKKLATYLLTGILGDTVFLRYTENSKKTLKIVSELVSAGAEKDFVSENFYELYEFTSLKLLGEFLGAMKKGPGFVWAAIPYEIFEKYGKPEGVREMAADLFFRGVKGAEFGIAMVEYEKNKMSLSFRSKKGTDVSGIAKLFGGGGHKNAAGATIEGEFSKTVKNVLARLVPPAPVNLVG